MADITALLFTNNTVYAEEWPRQFENKDYLSYYGGKLNFSFLYVLLFWF